MRRRRSSSSFLLLAAIATLPAAGRPPGLTCHMEADPAYVASKVEACPNGRVDWTWENRYRCYECGDSTPIYTGLVRTTGVGVCMLNVPCRPWKEYENHGVQTLEVSVRNKRHVFSFEALTCIDGTRSLGYGQCNCPQENTCDTSIGSPIILALAGDRLQLSSPAAGVRFDLDADGEAERTAWTVGGAGDAFLFLDRNGNQAVDDGSELFGEFTPQPPTDGLPRNGFAALALFDRPANGGNGDGFLSAADRIFAHLGLWLDDDHDGISQPEELYGLGELGADALDLHWRELGRVDRYGNRIRLAAEVLRDVQGTWRVMARAYDVWLAFFEETSDSAPRP